MQVRSKRAAPAVSQRRRVERRRPRASAADRSSRNGGRTHCTPRTDRGSRACPDRDRASPCRRRSADIGCGGRRDSWPRFFTMASMTPAIVLAAGRSSRMGRAKATLPAGDGDTFLTRIVRTVLDAGVDGGIVAGAPDAEWIARSFSESGLPARFVVNDRYDEGQLSSLLAGLSVID